MQTLIDLEPQTDCSSSTVSILQDVLAQAVTGERIAAMNYASLVEICSDAAEAKEALEHAAIERAHATAFVAAGRKIGVEVVANVDGKHWKRIRESFLRCVTERDYTGCLIIQEIMLESLALASYTRVANVAPGSLGKVFASIAADEQKHAAHAIAILKAERDADPARFDDKLRRLHDDVMTTLAKMLAKDCSEGHCEVCVSSCVKPALFAIDLSAAQLRGASLQQYLKTLDALGLPGEVTLTWIAQLPV